ncbi:sporulation transcriptional regulator SpoIIID [Christensenella sp. MSJ-20]|uniref:sporulation transcriptional regulator SpoIIID n=1 Tax=Christensenella sp. MSJ-20 TaxID=2841518 RepID=UPI000D7A67AC|nr:MAG: sporulation transcriptional regulator SpoIIID [Bacillota bacterium]QWT55041.1 sporulation transcriptional regulator SpoIIID [Christensenella sp. MSJ-20]
MQEYIERRVVQVADYILSTGATVRDAAKVFGMSKSTIHKDMSDRLRQINRATYGEVQKVLMKNKAERHIRGGLATHIKYKGADQ